MKAILMLIGINIIVCDADIWYIAVGQRVTNADVVPSRLAGEGSAIWQLDVLAVVGRRSPRKTSTKVKKQSILARAR